MSALVMVFGLASLLLLQQLLPLLIFAPLSTSSLSLLLSLGLLASGQDWLLVRRDKEWLKLGWRRNGRRDTILANSCFTLARECRLFCFVLPLLLVLLFKLLLVVAVLVRLVPVLLLVLLPVLLEALLPVPLLFKKPRENDLSIVLDLCGGFE